MNEKKEYWWIAMSTNGHFKTLHVDHRTPEEGEVDNEKWQNCLYFESEKEALNFCDKLKDFILKEYPRASEQGWFK